MMGKLLNERLQLLKLDSLQKDIRESKQHLEELNSELYESNKFFRQVFGQYMSTSLLEDIIGDKKETQLGGEEKYVTVLVSDLRGFTELAEKRNPKTVLNILNTYFEEMINIIHTHDGYINELLGDGILVIFGAPRNVGNCSLKAVKCAQEMQIGLKEVNKKLKIKDLPTLKMGIGINSGNLIVGNIGSQKRMKYGVVGDNINIAARIESLTTANQILISEATYKNIIKEVTPIGKLRTKIKGFKKPIMIYDVS